MSESCNGFLHDANDARRRSSDLPTFLHSMSQNRWFFLVGVNSLPQWSHARGSWSNFSGYWERRWQSREQNRFCWTVISNSCLQ